MTYGGSMRRRVGLTAWLVVLSVGISAGRGGRSRASMRWHRPGGLLENVPGGKDMTVEWLPTPPITRLRASKITFDVNATSQAQPVYKKTKGSNSSAWALLGGYNGLKPSPKYMTNTTIHFNVGQHTMRLDANHSWVAQTCKMLTA